MKDFLAESRKYFDKLAPRYERHYYGRHGRRQYERVTAVARAWKPASVLDVGCGTGGLLESLRRPKVKIAGADLSPVMIAEAKKRLGKIADLKVADSAKLPWKAGNFDLVVTTDSFHHWPDPWKALLEAKRVLKKGGHLILADVWAPSPLRQLGNLLARFSKEGDVKVYSKTEFARLLEDAGFVDVKLSHLSFSAIVLHAKAGISRKRKAPERR